VTSTRLSVSVAKSVSLALPQAARSPIPISKTFLFRELLSGMRSAVS
jgi:hypothetical protein